MTELPAEIRIGGALTPEQAQRLEELVIRLELHREWDDFVDGRVVDRESLLGCVEEGHLTFRDSQAAYGSFSELETFLVAEKLPYDCVSESQGDVGGCCDMYRPQWGETPRAVAAANDLAIMIAAAPALDAFRCLERGDVAEATKLLREALGPLVLPEAELPEFSILELP